ncbi:2-iminobutanoate/2-iminopropanoate deaminase [mine drainage metagenome]|uniref:2-iminobutanoate/2-iminopropanoate deaminase n=1 Tax=mine drainage metagenome TaxID=410659 RepID=A0A1J5SHT8_9ZZZZ
MEITRLDPGPRMSEATVCNGIAWLAGQIAEDHPNAPVGEQMREITARIDAVLARLGSDKSRLLSATIYLADIGDFAAMNAVWDAWVVPGHTPARATVEARLAAPAYAVEVQVVAALNG